MPLRGSVPKRYAEAILELGLERGTVKEWRASLARVSAALGRDALRLLGSPSVGMVARRRALDASLGGEPADVRALLDMLLEREAIGMLPLVARAYDDLVDEREGIRKALVATAVPLDDARRREVTRELERAVGRRLRARFEVDPELLGGAVVRVGDHEIDGSVRTRLARLRDRLATG